MDHHLLHTTNPMDSVMHLFAAAYYRDLNIFERKVYRGILGPVYDDEKENWRILTNKEIYAMVKKPTITDNKVT